MHTEPSFSSQSSLSLSPFISSTTIQSAHALKYLSVLCRHFARKVEAQWDDTQGTVFFVVGTTTLRVNTLNDALTVTCHADNQDMLERQQSIINHHVALFSRRESIALQWAVQQAIR